MFKLECFVDDKRLATVHRALDGLVFELKTTLVTHAEPTKGGKLKSTAPNGSLEEHIRGFLRTHKKPTFATAELKAEAIKVGCVPSSYSNVLRTLLNKKAISKTKAPYIYKINRRKL